MQQPKLVAELPEHAACVDAVLGRAFGPGRYAKTSERVRERGAAPAPRLSRVALSSDGEVTGVCRIWRVKLEAPCYFMGPLAVDPAARNQGLGLTLAREATAACRASGEAGGIIVVGSEKFFAPLGFTVAPKGRLHLPGPVNPARLLWLELRPGGLDKVQGLIG